MNPFTMEDKYLINSLSPISKNDLIKQLETLEPEDSIAETYLKDIKEKIQGLREDEFSILRNQLSEID